MAGLVSFNRKNTNLANIGFDDFYNMLDDFFSDNRLSGHRLSRNTFKIDVREAEGKYLIEAELPGVKKEEIDLNADNETLCISVNLEETASQDKNDYIYRERRNTSMSRSIRLAKANMAEITAKLDNGILIITIPIQENVNNSHKINID